MTQVIIAHEDILLEGVGGTMAHPPAMNHQRGLLVAWAMNYQFVTDGGGSRSFIKWLSTFAR